MTDNLIVFENKGIGSWCKFSQNLLYFHMLPWKCQKKRFSRIPYCYLKVYKCVSNSVGNISNLEGKPVSNKISQFLPKEAIFLNQESIQVQDVSSEEVSVHSVRQL